MLRTLRTNAYKGLCGLLVAFSLAVLPLPALADTAADQNQLTTTTPAETPSPADTTPQNTNPATDATPSNIESIPETTPVANEGSQTPAVQALTQTIANTTATVENTVQSAAQSGEALVLQNEIAGNATSGNSTTQTTILNVVNANGASAPGFDTFQCDITGENESDIVIDPSSLLPICTTTSVGSNTAQPSASGEGIQTGASLVDILNNIVLSATSGDATVTGNETAGNATTGDATALANVVNIANTNISAQHAFLGIINIFGNLKGNILVPQALVDSLAGIGGGAGNIDTTSIANTISATAQSGNATVSDNETAGDAATGDATTGITVLNLTGQQVVAKNSLLVFVNVLGKWMGMIVPAPGSSIAMLGSGVQGSADGLGSGLNNTDSQTNTSIANNISLQAQSGNATVAGNETAGDATSGKASAGANLLNITNSDFRLDDWFGALFINVLGSWLGNFGIQAALADSGDNGSADVVQDAVVYQFTEPTDVAEPADTDISVHVSNANTATATGQSAPETRKGVVLDAHTQKNQTTDDGAPIVSTDPLTLIGLTIAFAIIIATGTLTLRHKLLA
jgi:hypothetical protein